MNIPSKQNGEKTFPIKENLFIELKVDEQILLKIPITIQEVYQINIVIQDLIKRENSKREIDPILNPSLTKSANTEAHLINAVKNKVIENIDKEHFGVNEICKLLGVNRMHLHRCFKSTIGISTLNYIQKIRIEKAKKLLLKKDDQIREVAFLVGFSDPCYFTRVFSRHVGMSPTEFVKNNNS
ncbi:MAG: AraC family transcriptional regulator [Saprospiraceae bacterium]